MGGARQSSRCLGERGGRSGLRPGLAAGGSPCAGRASQTGMAAEADHHLLPHGTARSRCCWARPNGRRTHAAELQQHAVAYINTDGNGRGFLYAEGAHSLEALVNGVARDVQDPEAGISVWKRSQASASTTPKMPRRGRPSAIAPTGSCFRWDREPTTPSSNITSESRRSTWAMAEKTARESITPSTTTFTGTRTFPTPTLFTARRWHRPWA